MHSSSGSLISRSSSAAGLPYALDAVKRKRARRPKADGEHSSEVSYTDIDDQEQEGNSHDQWSCQSDTSGEGPDGHHLELEASISDILDSGDPRQPLPEEKKQKGRKQTPLSKTTESKDLLVAKEDAELKLNEDFL